MRQEKGLPWPGLLPIDFDSAEKNKSFDPSIMSHCCQLPGTLHIGLAEFSQRVLRIIFNQVNSGSTVHQGIEALQKVLPIRMAERRHLLPGKSSMSGRCRLTGATDD